MAQYSLTMGTANLLLVDDGLQTKDDRVRLKNAEKSGDCNEHERAKRAKT